MKTVMTETEVRRVATDIVPLAMLKLPFDGQDPHDKTLAEHYLLKAVSSTVASRLKKLDEAAKSEFKDGAKPTLTKNWRREVTRGTARELFDLDAFIEAIIKTYPQIMKHQLKEIADKSKKASAVPLSVTIEYIGDVRD